MQTKYKGNIIDALLLFNILNNNYILLSSRDDNEYSKLYEFKENTKFVKNIYGTNEHKTFLLFLGYIKINIISLNAVMN